MDKTDYTFFDQQVERFLRREMSADEEQHFRQILVQNHELRQRAALTAKMIKEMRVAQQQADQQVIDDVKNMNLKQLKAFLSLGEHRRRWPRYAIAASVAVVMAMAGWLYYNNQTISADRELANAAYFTYRPDIKMIGASRGSSDSVLVAHLTYLFAKVNRNDSVESVTQQLEKLYQRAATDETLRFYQDDIAWNLAIAYLKQGKRQRAKDMLQEMIDRNKNYPEITRPAKKLLESIE